MREQFEVLTKIAQALNEHQSIFFDEEMNRYKTLSSIAADAMVTLYIDGAWYAFQEQQKVINGMLECMDDAIRLIDEGNSWDAKELLK